MTSKTQGQNPLRETAVVEKAQKKNNISFCQIDIQDTSLMRRRNKNHSARKKESSVRASLFPCGNVPAGECPVVTDTKDLVDYLLSTAAFSDLKNRERQEIYGLLDRFKREGTLRIPKEYGMFVCRV